ncbi:proteasome subunit beta type-7-like [Dermatophagoides pteronyssinus]|uniref:proteasome subunit beta type-7-like n=1 Tax=Dermatophagoides pteronyssinus TaxID=6956 RepID=UPI003F672E5E
MSSKILPEIPTGGFNFENFQRNEYLKEKGYPIPKVQKTGTTIAGIIFKDGVILGADTRATSGSVVADKNCVKIHYLAKNMYCCGAGTAADTDAVTRMISSQLELLRLNTGKQVPVCVANRLIKQYLYRYQGYVGAALVLGGVDKFGPRLYSVAPHGSTDKLPYATMGSGSLAAMAVFETRWKPDLSLEDGKKLVRDAIAAGIFNDLGSGSNIDLCIITKQDVQYLRPYDEANLKGKRQGTYQYARNTTAIIGQPRIIPIEVESEQTITIGEESMDTSS